MTASIIRRQNANQAARRLLLAAALIVTTGLPGSAEGEAHPDKVGAEECGQCHKKELKAWSRSTHSVVLSDREDESVVEKGDEYAEALEIDDIEIAPECNSCHFTYYLDQEGDEALTAVDCESCHGLGKQWMDVHSDYGNKDGKPIENAEDEDPAHAQMRWTQSEAAGMLRPGNIVAVTSNCFQCHTGPGERIVNTGGHTPGSDFDLPRWLAGEVRHNFHRTNQGANAETKPERRRQLYVLGRALQLQYALEGLAGATQEGKYAMAMAKRASDAIAALEAINAKANTPEITAIIAAGKAAPTAPGSKPAAEAAAAKVAKSAAEFGKNHDGSKLGAIDSLIPPGAKGTPFAGN